MINLELTDEEAFLLGEIFRVATKERKFVATAIESRFRNFNWERVNLGNKVQDAAGAEMCSPYLEEKVS
jgi:hypothetical protein